MDDKPADVQNETSGIQKPTLVAIAPRQSGKTFAAQTEKSLELVLDHIVRLLDLTERPEPDSSPADHGMDSLQFIELVLDLEDATERDFPEDLDVNEKSTLREIAAFVAKESV
jgi:acyl carrier protein